MRDFDYRGGALYAEDVDLKRIAREVGTPFYCYSTAAIARRYRALRRRLRRSSTRSSAMR